MELTPERVVVTDITELGVIATLAEAFVKYARAELGMSDEAMALAESGVRGIQDVRALILNVRATTRIDANDTMSFGNPAKMIIEFGVATFEQRPELIEPYMLADDIESARIFFPPVGVEPNAR